MPLWNLFIKFDVVVATFKNLQIIVGLKEPLKKTDMQKVA